MEEVEVMGYIFLACKKLNLDEKTVIKLRDSMLYNMATLTGEEATKQGFEYFVNLIDGGTPQTEEKPKNINRELLEQEFQQLWMMYPRRLGKVKAYKAYVQARKRGATYEQIEAGLKDYLDYINLNKVDVSFVKHGSSWFQNHGWEDDYSQH